MAQSKIRGSFAALKDDDEKQATTTTKNKQRPRRETNDDHGGKQTTTLHFGTIKLLQLFFANHVYYTGERLALA